MTTTRLARGAVCLSTLLATSNMLLVTPVRGQPAPRPAPAVHPQACDARGGDTPPTHTFSIQESLLTMSDGVRLAATLFQPMPRTPGERFPTLLELLPYRKDDSFFLRDFPLYAYFACRGLLAVKVDVRGTGGSTGSLPPREYSKQELRDAEEVIAMLAARPESNGRVGMWGISWGGFNALQVAARRPPALRAVLALHASDDLYFDDVRFLDGVLHFDPYALQIDHENGLPRSPDYPVDSAYFADRFDTTPWLLTYLRHPLDGAFWREASVRHHPPLTIPAYLIGGLADGYRDTPLRLLERSAAPVKVEMGPWGHAWPDNGAPGPNYEWRSRAVRWWRHWLLDQDTGLLDEPALLLFVRDSVPPGSAQRVPGAFRFIAWPRGENAQRRWVSTAARTLVAAPDREAQPAIDSGTAARTLPATSWDTLRHIAGRGGAAGVWWGDAPGDMAPDDRAALVFDSEPLGTPLVTAGFAAVRLRARSSMPRVQWSVRLEDIFPDGRAALVTGRVVNGTLRDGGTAMRPRGMHEVIDTTLHLHFTSWTYRPGHRIRVSVSHAQFPLAWPSPYRGWSLVASGAEGLSLTLPLLSDTATPATLPTPEPRMRRSDARLLSSASPPPRFGRNDQTGAVHYAVEQTSRQRIRGADVDYREVVRYEANERRPWRAAVDARAVHTITKDRRRLQLETRIAMTSTLDSLQVTVTRALAINGRAVRRRAWSESLPRVAH